MKYKLLLLFVLIALYSEAQVGLRIGYGKSNFEQWKIEANQIVRDDLISFLENSANVGIDYWFRLKKRRVEFLPQIGYTSYAKSNVRNIEYAASTFDFYFNTHVYILDLEEDCNCPTFSKQGNIIKKGFFLHVAPAIKAFNVTGKSSIATSKINEFGFGLKFGAGLDIGINDFVTITPIANYEVTSMLPWQGLNTLVTATETPNNITSNYSRLFFETRLGFRFDNDSKFKRGRR